ncbi:uncharacterized protein PSFLO_03253 [Pseudozyma flocculosa]|uniref:Uncharacterized protein n=1 Tax=Pseudozyma flocculosa TaxID=84751 RepID=A0A5C3F222_9BASI|nr:uncharacterized protein PSFLO_03253 [Pseudozyma flocculosa]
MNGADSTAAADPIPAAAAMSLPNSEGIRAGVVEPPEDLSPAEIMFGTHGPASTFNATA